MKSWRGQNLIFRYYDPEYCASISRPVLPMNCKEFSAQFSSSGRKAKMQMPCWNSGSAAASSRRKQSVVLQERCEFNRVEWRGAASRPELVTWTLLKVDLRDFSSFQVS